MFGEAPTFSSKLARKAASNDAAFRGRIVAGARRHFFVHGLRSVTMDELARALGMSKKTFYRHFPSKYALVEAAILDKFQQLETELEGIASERTSDFPAVLQRLLACFQRHTDEIQPPFLRDIQREAPEVLDLVEARRSDIVQRYFGRLLSDGVRAGIIRDDIPVGLLVEILLGAVRAVMSPQTMIALDLTPKSGFLAISGVFFKGIVTEEGRMKL